MLLIRTDANKQIGMGHVMRCLTIAKAANGAGIQSVFLLADEEAAEFLKEQQQEVCILHTDYARMEEEIPVLLKETKRLAKKQSDPMAKQKEPQVLLIDSYRITCSYLKRVRKSFCAKEGGKLALLEDYGNIPYETDILINYNIYGPDFSYEKQAKTVLAGCDYMPLRPEFAKQEYSVRKTVKDILVTTGAGDPYRIGEKLAKQFAGRTDFCLHIVCGKFSESREALLLLEKEYKNIKVYQDVKKMWELMAACDVAVSAAGTTLYELCAIGVPAVCFSFADNQVLPGKAFAAKTPVVYAGDYEKEKESVILNIREEVEKLAAMTQEERRKISGRLKGMVDGKGAERIVGKLFFKEGIHEKTGNEF